MLRTFSDLLRACTREDDVAVRLGGEEFALVLSGVGEREALAVAERLRREVASTFRDFPVPISVSVGIAEGVRNQDPETLVRDANRALFAAKRLGRDRCVVHHAETLAMLDALADDRAGEQLAAAMLLAETLDLRDVATARHSETVGRYAEQIAQEMGLEPVQVERVRVAGVLHDIGKLGISDAVLLKPGALERHEWEEIMRHPELGARILEHANLRDVANWVLSHHERLDGVRLPARPRGRVDPARGPHPRGRRRLRGDDRRPPVPLRPHAGRGASRAAPRRRLAVRPRRGRRVRARARRRAAAELAVVPGRGVARPELQRHPLRRLPLHVLARRRRRARRRRSARAISSPSAAIVSSVAMDARSRP